MYQISRQGLNIMYDYDEEDYIEVEMEDVEGDDDWDGDAIEDSVNNDAPAWEIDPFLDDEGTIREIDFREITGDYR
tara:strand:- start:148 stop:375 length:228 start_codon:yes stop_codon:yes gene_type:complete